MTSSPYQSTMHHAQKILWVMAVVILLTSFAADMLSLDVPSSYDSSAQAGSKSGKLFSAVANAFYSAAFPFFGAAVLHRIDIALRGKL